MALGTTDITTAMVANALGISAYDVGTLCTSSQVNVWSKARPGYWTYVGSVGNDAVIKYQPPRGDGYTDPRGTDPQTGDGKEGYKLGDFREYNHYAQIPYAESTQYVATPNQAGSTVNVPVKFYTKEFNFKNLSSNQYREKNALSTATKILVIKSDGTVLGAMDIPDENSFDTINAAITAPAAGSTLNIDYYIGIGVGSEIGDLLYYFGDANGNRKTYTLSVRTQQNPHLAYITSNSNDVHYESTNAGYWSPDDNDVDFNVTPDNMYTNVHLKVKKNGTDITSNCTYLGNNVDGYNFGVWEEGTAQSGSITIGSGVGYDDEFEFEFYTT